MTSADYHPDLDDLVMVRLQPHLCAGCGHYVGRALLSLEPVFDDTGSIQGLATASWAVCCGYMDGSNVPPEALARTLNQLRSCRRSRDPHHPKESP